MLYGGGIKGIQGNTGQAIVTEQYAHTLDDSRRVNAERVLATVLLRPVSEEQAKQFYPIQELYAGGKQALLLKLFIESPEMASMIKSLAQTM